MGQLARVDRLCLLLVERGVPRRLLWILLCLNQALDLWFQLFQELILDFIKVSLAWLHFLRLLVMIMRKSRAHNVRFNLPAGQADIEGGQMVKHFLLASKVTQLLPVMILLFVGAGADRFRDDVAHVIGLPWRHGCILVKPRWRWHLPWHVWLTLRERMAAALSRHSLGKVWLSILSFYDLDEVLYVLEHFRNWGVWLEGLHWLESSYEYVHCTLWLWLHDRR